MSEQQDERVYAFQGFWTFFFFLFFFLCAVLDGWIWNFYIIIPLAVYILGLLFILYSVGKLWANRLYVFSKCIWKSRWYV